MAFYFSNNNPKIVEQKFTRSIIFQEQAGEKIMNASTDEDLAKSCLIILKERYENPTLWAYLPANKNITDEEKEFLEFYKTDYFLLPMLLQRMSESVKRRIETRLDEGSDPDWIWYHHVEELLSMTFEVGEGYRIPYKGRYIPTSYYLLLQRRNNPGEGFILVNKELN